MWIPSIITDQKLASTGFRPSRDTAIDDEIRVEAAESEIVNAHHHAAFTPGGVDPPLRVAGNRVVDDEHIGLQRANQLRGRAAHHVAAQ